MFSFLKDNSYTIFKMFVNQIGMTIFGLAVSFATSNFDGLFLGASVFGVLFYLVLLYTMTWEEGFRQSQAIEAGRKKYIPLSGLYMSLCANLINIVLGVLVVAGFYGASTYSAEGFPSAPDWSVNCYGIGKMVSKLLNGVYAGIVTRFETFPWVYLLIVVPSLAVCTVAYILGVKGIHLTGLVGNKPNRE
ncbi:MAG: hypothetical protein IKS28_01750 [Clostridia bacterium]|nr:hypothetical protein [Clostridia bacterium]